MDNSFVLFPFIVLAITICLILPTQFVRKRYKAYSTEMGQFIRLDTFEKLTNSDVKRYMVETDEKLSTRSIREHAYNYFVEYFSKMVIADLNNSTNSNKQKLRKLEHLKAILTMQFEVKSLDIIDVAITKLSENIKL
ncbi:hypothetical protein AwErysi_01030 [Erysipelotrichaceae bacterium]|nr:hypothetical protein AwErysi_01030 [Erysipelotrichaceae bacterium]